jgi:hypothetical protein
MFVFLPGHPLYGRQIRVVKHRVSKTYVSCLIEDPTNAGFHYRIKAKWLSISPPLPEAMPISANAPICLSMPALDRMVQMILAQSQAGRNEADDQLNEWGRTPNLGTVAGQEQENAQRAPLLPGSEASWRHSS